MNNTDQFLIEEPVVIEKLGRIASKIAYYNFEWRFITLVILNSVYQVLLALQSFLNTYNKTIHVKFGKYIPHRRAIIPQFVIFGKDSIEIIDIIKWMDQSRYDNSGKYIIICVNDNYKKCDEKKVFQTLAEVKIVNVVYLRGVDDFNYVSFSYELVLPDNCENNTPEILNINTECPHNDCFKTIFPDKFNNFHKCSFYISTFEQPPFMYLQNQTMEPTGSDGDIIKLVANALNATLVVKTPEEGSAWGHYENNNWTGSLGDVFNHRVHASVCSLPVSDRKYGNFQISYIYNTMDIVWVAEIPSSKPAWTKLLYPMKMTLRIAIFCMFIVIVLLNCFLKTIFWRKVTKVLKIKPPRSNLLFYSWALFLGTPILSMPSNRVLQWIICNWIWYSFIIKTGYQAGLMSSLKNKIYEDYFPDFETVLKSKHPYGGLPTLQKYYAEDSHIYDNWVSLDFDEAYSTLEEISDVSSNFVLAFNKEIIIEHLFNYNGTRQLQILPQKIVNSPTVMYFRKHSVIEPSVSQVLSRLVEAGLTQFWHKRYLRYMKFFFQRSEDHKEEPFTFDNFKACLALLVFGWILSIIFFAFEFFCGRIERTERTNRRIT